MSCLEPGWQRTLCAAALTTLECFQKCMWTTEEERSIFRSFCTIRCAWMVFKALEKLRNINLIVFPNDHFAFFSAVGLAPTANVTTCQSHTVPYFFQIIKSKIVNFCFALRSFLIHLSELLHLYTPSWQFLSSADTRVFRIPSFEQSPVVGTNSLNRL